jgi:hypothetical protein
MKNKRKIIFKLILILILIILFIKIFFLKGLINVEKIDDFLFLKLFSNGVYQKNSTQDDKYKKIYEFKINYKNLDFKSLNLSDTIDKNTLIYEKIAPGTSGSFDILLYSNQNLKYRIEFDSINKKPKNLKFKAFKSGEILEESNTLESLSKKLTGDINQNEKINITINWYWNYEDKENGEDTDIQDTKDCENIKSYKFNVYAFGEEII